MIHTESFFDELDKIGGFLGRTKSLATRALKGLVRAEDPIEVAGLGVLALPAIDNMIAKRRARAAGSKDVEKFRMVKSRFHDAADVGGLGILAAPLVAKRITTGKWGH